MTMLLKNNARTTLAAPATTGAGSLTVQSGAVFPGLTPVALTGSVTSSGFRVTGAGTQFLAELPRFSSVWAVVNGQVEARYVVAVEDDTTLLLDRAFSTDLGTSTSLTKGSVLSLTLADGIAGFEHIACVGIAGDVLSVYREQDGSTAKAFPTGAVVEARVTKSAIEGAVARAVWNTLALLEDPVLAAELGVDVPGLTATTLNAALQEILSTVQAHLTAASGAHDATEISFGPHADWAADNVDAAIQEALADASAALQAHVTASTAHNAGQTSFSPYGPLSQTTVQAAIEKLADIAESSGAEKIRDAVETAGLVWNPSDDFLLSRAIGRYVSLSDFYVDSGSENAKVLTPLDGFRVPPAAYVNGMRARFRANLSNTGGTTVNVGGLGVVNIVRRNGTALQKWDIIAGDEVELTYDSTLGAFVLPGVWSGQVLTTSYQSASNSAAEDLTVSYAPVFQGSGLIIISNGRYHDTASGLSSIKVTISSEGLQASSRSQDSQGMDDSAVCAALTTFVGASGASHSVVMNTSHTETAITAMRSKLLTVQFIEVRP